MLQHEASRHVATAFRHACWAKHASPAGARGSMSRHDMACHTLSFAAMRERSLPLGPPAKTR
eukprot:364013-Chlamydomonas_euryale.AAC.4